MIGRFFFFLLIYVAMIIVGMLGAASILGERAVVLPGEIMADVVAMAVVMAAVMVAVMVAVMAAVVDVDMEIAVVGVVTVVCCGSRSPVIWTITDWVKEEVVILEADMVVAVGDSAEDVGEDVEEDAAAEDSVIRVSLSAQGRRCPNRSQFPRTG